MAYVDCTSREKLRNEKRNTKPFRREKIHEKNSWIPKILEGLEEVRWKREEGRGKREEGRGKREEGRGKRDERRGKRKEERGKRKEERGKRTYSQKRPLAPILRRSRQLQSVHTLVLAILPTSPKKWCTLLALLV
jgi:hypothetical protein